MKFVEVPAGAKPGDRVSFEGLPVEPPATAKQVEKKKIAEQVCAEYMPVWLKEYMDTHWFYKYMCLLYLYVLHIMQR